MAVNDGQIKQAIRDVYQFFNVKTGNAVQIFDARVLKKMRVVPEKHMIISFCLTNEKILKIKSMEKFVYSMHISKLSDVDK